MRYLWTILVAILVLPASAEELYLDSSASGANDGTSWTNAWEAPEVISWGSGTGSVGAGDTLWVSGGAYGSSNVYATNFIIGASGTDGSPIIIKASQETNHNGKVVFLDTISFANRKYITLDGRKDDDYVYPIATELTNIVDNINWQIMVTNVYVEGADDYAVWINGDSGLGLRLYGLELGPMGEIPDNTNSASEFFGMKIYDVDQLDDCVFEGLYVHDCQQEGINQSVVQSITESWDNLIIRHSWFTSMGADCIKWTSPGFTLVNSLIGTPGSIYGSQSPIMDHGHPDSIQFSNGRCDYSKIINNVMYPKRNSFIKGETLAVEGGTHGNYMWAGNIFVQPRDFYKEDGALQEGISMQLWNENDGVSVDQCYWEGINFVNNTLYHNGSGSSIPLALTRATPDGGTRSVWRVDVTNSIIANNLGIDQRYNAVNGDPCWSLASGAGAQGDPVEGTTNGFFYYTNTVEWKNNIIAVETTGDTTFRYHGVLYTNGESLGLGNSSVLPSVESTTNYDLRLQRTDTVAKGQGADLSSLTNTFPEYATDIWGNERFVDGVADIGAHSVSGISAALRDNVTNGLQLWIRFDETPPVDEDGETNEHYLDYSTNAYHGWHTGYLYDHASSNRFPDQVTWTNANTGTKETAGSFTRHVDGWDIYGLSGDYLAVCLYTNIQSLTNATIAFWGRYTTPADTNMSGWTNWAAEGNRSYLSGAAGYDGSWEVGLDATHWTVWQIGHDGSGKTSVRGAPSYEIRTTGKEYEGESTNMHHYVLAWDSGVATAYFNGSAITTNSDCVDSNVLALTIRGPSGGLSGGFFSIGSSSHRGNPYLTPYDDIGNQYPNHGQHRGYIDDVRIYDRTLSTAEIEAIYYSTNYSVADAVTITVTNASDPQYVSASPVSIGGTSTTTNSSLTVTGTNTTLSAEVTVNPNGSNWLSSVTVTEGSTNVFQFTVADDQSETANTTHTVYWTNTPAASGTTNVMNIGTLTIY